MRVFGRRKSKELELFPIEYFGTVKKEKTKKEVKLFPIKKDAPKGIN